MKKEKRKGKKIVLEINKVIECVIECVKDSPKYIYLYTLKKKILF